ncbi:MAG: 50S ribosomal protein L10 [Candidatus Riflebacteria bacterium]|nr:50S ribosomal protein L10 [Candidatus Riflebacteria bacterium]
MKSMSEKQAYVDEFKEKLSKAGVVVVTGCAGVTANDMTALRKAVRESGAEFAVVKNTLLARALADTPMEDLQKDMVGNTAIAFGYEDPIAPVKAMFEFASKSPKLVFKSGFMDGEVLDPAKLEAISKIPGKKELYSMLASAFQGPIRKFACAIDALRKKREEEQAAA